MLMRKISGREKMDLLAGMSSSDCVPCKMSQYNIAEDLVEQSKKALMSPFRLEQCLKIAESQCDRTRNNDDLVDPG